jgi:hypothetical protein
MSLICRARNKYFVLRLQRNLKMQKRKTLSCWTIVSHILRRLFSSKSGGLFIEKRTWYCIYQFRKVTGRDPRYAPSDYRLTFTWCLSKPDCLIGNWACSSESKVVFTPKLQRTNRKTSQSSNLRDVVKIFCSNGGLQPRAQETWLNKESAYSWRWVSLTNQYSTQRIGWVSRSQNSAYYYLTWITGKTRSG